TTAAITEAYAALRRPVVSLGATLGASVGPCRAAAMARVLLPGTKVSPKQGIMQIGGLSCPAPVQPICLPGLLRTPPCLFFDSFPKPPASILSAPAISPLR